MRSSLLFLIVGKRRGQLRAKNVAAFSVFTEKAQAGDVARLVSFATARGWDDAVPWSETGPL
jgi:hypothetical protein